MTYTARSIHPTIAEINLQAFQQNIFELKKKLHQTKLLAVVKTNAYGHGLLEVSKAAIAAGADRLGVTSVEARSEERRVGKEWRCRGARECDKENEKSKRRVRRVVGTGSG